MTHGVPFTILHVPVGKYHISTSDKWKRMDEHHLQSEWENCSPLTFDLCCTSPTAFQLQLLQNQWTDGQTEGSNRSVKETFRLVLLTDSSRSDGAELFSQYVT